MVTFNDRFSEYISDMLLSVPTAAGILGASQPTIYAYMGNQKAKRTPDYAGLVSMSRTFAVTMDWLSGEAAYPKWRPEVYLTRLWLRGQLAGLPIRIRSRERVFDLVAKIKEHLPQARQEWFVPGVLGLTGEQFAAVESDEAALTQDIVERLSNFSGVPKTWIRLGETGDLEKPDLGLIGQDWIGVVEMYALKLGDTPERHLAHGHDVHDFLDLLARSRNT